MRPKDAKAYDMVAELWEFDRGTARGAGIRQRYDAQVNPNIWREIFLEYQRQVNKHDGGLKFHIWLAGMPPDVSE